MHNPKPDAAAQPAECRVSEAESGQKLLQFLQRRLQLPPSLLHRWLRTGQVRLNGGRCKPFARVQQGDTVRLPPFALKLAAQAQTKAASRLALGVAEGPASDSEPSMPLPPLLGQESGLLAFCKPAGLPVHGGTGHSVSLASLLAAHFAHADFCPTPVHRLDKDTSGVLLVASSYAALRDAQESLRQGLWHKEYLAWVHGRWPWQEDRLLQHLLHKTSHSGFEKMQVSLVTREGQPPAREARCLVRCVQTGARASLMQVRLLTGRTHQIRVQLAQMGHPVLGDAKYGGREASSAPAHGTRNLLLHSMRVCLPGGPAFTALPDWPAPFGIASLPEPLERFRFEKMPDT